MRRSTFFVVLGIVLTVLDVPGLKSLPPWVGLVILGAGIWLSNAEDRNQ